MSSGVDNVGSLVFPEAQQFARNRSDSFSAFYDRNHLLDEIVRHDNVQVQGKDVFTAGALDALVDGPAKTEVLLIQNVFCPGIEVLQALQRSVGQTVVDDYQLYRSVRLFINGRDATLDKPSAVPVEHDNGYRQAAHRDYSACFFLARTSTSS